MANENSEPQALPENADVGEAADLIASLDNAPVADDAAQPEAQPAAEAAPEAEGEPVAEEATAEEGEGEEQEAEPVSLEAPEFWSAEDKAAWATVPPQLQPILQKYEQQRIKFANDKAREASEGVKAAQEQAKAALDRVEAGVSWWQQHGPQFFKTFGDKWASVDWNKMAEENPAEWARLKQQAENEAMMLREAQARAQADEQIATQRMQQTLAERKRAAHETISQAMPEFYAGEKAAQTYDKVGKYLLERGIPAERINAIHEAPIIEMATKAMLYDEARKTVSAVTQQPRATDGKFTVKTTPTRVQPGPSARTGNRNADAARQVVERFKKAGDMQSAADAIRALNL